MEPVSEPVSEPLLEVLLVLPEPLELPKFMVGPGGAGGTQLGAADPAAKAREWLLEDGDQQDADPRLSSGAQRLGRAEHLGQHRKHQWMFERLKNPFPSFSYPSRFYSSKAFLSFQALCSQSYGLFLIPWGLVGIFVASH